MMIIWSKGVDKTLNLCYNKIRNRKGENKMFILDLEKAKRIISTSEKEIKLAALYKMKDELKIQLDEIEDEIYQIELELLTKKY